MTPKFCGQCRYCRTLNMSKKGECCRHAPFPVRSTSKGREPGIVDWPIVHVDRPACGDGADSLYEDSVIESDR